MGAGSGPPCGARIILHGADKLFVYQDSVPDGKITFPVQVGTQHTHPLSSFLPGLIDVRRRGVMYLGSPPDNELYRPIGLAPRKVLLVGAR